ncbi:MAG: amidohydrolase family protein [Gemmatimonadetes bacterium]|nr:amidohydrolase family protein [Gemmatimonadota bacterium]
MMPVGHYLSTVLPARRFGATMALVALAAALGCSGGAGDANGIDPQLAREIAAIKAIDNHAHPVRPTAADEAPDMEFDALPVDNLEPQSDPLRQRAKSPIVAAAHTELFGTDKAAVVKAHASDYATFMLDKMGIETMLSNRVAMGPGLPSDRFLWVPFADALMYPLNNAALITTPDQKSFFPLEDKLLKRYYAESGVAAKPATLGEYLEKVVRGTLERHKKGGALAEKFEMAYLRTLAVGNPTRAQAERGYAGSAADYTALQDYIFRFIITECGRLGMAVHIHVAHGGGGYFNVSWANPLLLEPLLNDPTLRKTNFVMIHGGWPYTHEITPLLTKPNAYVDYSEQTAFNAPHDVAEVLRSWLAYEPEKVLFATDAYPESAELGWEEMGMYAANVGRESLVRALTSMMRDGEITHERALELATMVLRDNARKLYGLK